MALSGLSRFMKHSPLPLNVEDYHSSPLDRLLPEQALSSGFLESDFYVPRYYSLLKPRIGASPLSYRLGEVKNEKDKFKVMLNVNQFKPNEVEVKVVDNYVVIHGKHEERSDEHGFVEREFTRRYLLPEDVDAETVKSTLSKDGVLAVEAFKKVEPSPNERVIPITVESSGLLEGKP